MEINKTYYIFGKLEGTEEFQISKSVMISDNLLSWRKRPTDSKTSLHTFGTALGTPGLDPVLLRLEPPGWIWEEGGLGEIRWESILSAPICPLTATLIDLLTLISLSKTLAIFVHPAPALCLQVTSTLILLWGLTHPWPMWSSGWYSKVGL